MINRFLTTLMCFYSMAAIGQEFKISTMLSDTTSNRHVVIRDTLGYDSLVQEFFSNGQLFYQMPYRKGLQNGWSEQFHRNGTVSGKSLWIEGRTIDGLNIFFWENGNIHQRGFYKNGHQIGKWYSYSMDGKPMSIYIYNKKGELIKMKDWDEENKKWMKTSGIR